MDDKANEENDQVVEQPPSEGDILQQQEQKQPEPEEKKDDEGVEGDKTTEQETLEVKPDTPVTIVEDEGGEGNIITEEEMEQDSIIEMEVDDSNTGDTITSNPEIDLGYAAAAATAVIMEEPDPDPDEIDNSGPIIVSTSTQSTLSLTLGPVVAEVRSEDESKSSEEQKIEEITVNTDTEPIPQSYTPPERDPIPESAESPDEVKGDSPEEPMETTDTPAEPDDIVRTSEPIFADSGPEIELNEPTEPESDSALEIEADQGFLNEEESMSSMPDDTVDVDKENALGLGDVDDDNDEETFLEITRRRISQDREGNCYCGKDRNFNIAELLCASCYRWFHESCISYQLGKLVPFVTNYIFTCKNCSPTGLECFKRNQAQFSQMCVTALANLTQASIKEGTNQKKFSKDKDIIPFFEMHWEALTTTTRRMTQSWHSTVTKTLLKDAGTVYSCHEVADDELSPYFGLVSDDLTQIRPNYEAMIKTGQLKITDQRNSSSSLRGRGAKRRTVTDQTAAVQNNINKKPRSEMFGPKPVIGHGYPTEHPFNKDSYRYILAEPDPNAPFRQEFDESNEWSGKPIHGWLCRVVNPSSVLLALHDRAPQLKVSEDRLSVTGEKGYCMIRATHGVSRGAWYYEAKIVDMPEGSATRIGFSQQFGNLQGPLGFDRYGYSWRSRYGTAFHEAKGKSYAKGGYGLDDVLGFLIILPEEKNVSLVPTSFKDRPLVKVKSHLYYEDKDDPKELERRDRRKGSKIICFKNGVCQGVAFEDIFCGTYYPTLSLYKSITVRVNFGPDFEATPATDLEYRAMSERAECSVIEQTMADMLYLTDNEGKLRLDNAVPMPL